MRVLLKDGIDVKLADVRRYVEEERKPADPVEELDFADLADLGWKTLHGFENLPEKGDYAGLFLVWGTFEAGIAFANRQA